jgi:hypothetical protein
LGEAVPAASVSAGWLSAAVARPEISHALSEGPTPLAFCLKGGKFGPEDMFMEMLSTMERGEQ